MISDPPFDGDVPGDGDDAPYEWLDEWLCEYVDGTMDPSLEAVFEQYVEANPELKAHVERLRETRELLCNCGRPLTAPSDVEAEVCRAVECDMLQSPAPVADAMWRRPLAAFGVASSVAVALVVGFLIGATVVGPSPVSTPVETTAQEDVEHPIPPPAAVQSRPTAAPQDAPLRPRYLTGPVSPADSVRPPSALTTIGLP